MWTTLNLMLAVISLFWETSANGGLRQSRIYESLEQGAIPLSAIHFSLLFIISYCHMVVKKSWIIFNFICLENVNPNFNRNPRFYSLHFTLRIMASMPKKVNCTKLSRQQFSSARLPFFAIRWVAKQLILKSTLAQSNETESEWVVKLANWQHLTSFTVKILWFCINQHPLHITDSIFSVRML